MTCIICKESSNQEFCNICTILPEALKDIISGQTPFTDYFNVNGEMIGYGPKNWMFYPEIVKRLKEVKRPIIITILTNNPNFGSFVKGNTAQVEEIIIDPTFQYTNRMTITHSLISQWINIDDQNETWKLNKKWAEEKNIIKSKNHEGMKYNHYSNRWTWL